MKGLSFLRFILDGSGTFMDHASGYILARDNHVDNRTAFRDREPARSSRVKGVRSGPTVGGPPTIEGAGRVSQKSP